MSTPGDEENINEYDFETSREETNLKDSRISIKKTAEKRNKNTVTTLEDTSCKFIEAYLKTRSHEIGNAPYK